MKCTYSDEIKYQQMIIMHNEEIKLLGIYLDFEILGYVNTMFLLWFNLGTELHNSSWKDIKKIQITDICYDYWMFLKAARGKATSDSAILCSYSLEIISDYTGSKEDKDI